MARHSQLIASLPWFGDVYLLSHRSVRDQVAGGMQSNNYNVWGCTIKEKSLQRIRILPSKGMKLFYMVRFR